MSKSSLKFFIHKSDHAFLPDKYRFRLHQPFIGKRAVNYIDGWTMIHFLNGVLFGYLYHKLKFNMNNYYVILLILHIIWETYQIIINSSQGDKLEGPNSYMDAFIDTVFFMAGAAIFKIGFYDTKK